MSATQRFVGIDVAKAQLDIALRPTGERWAVANDDVGIAVLVERLQAVQPTLMVLEATGGDQRAVVAALAAAGLPVAVVNPRHARDVAKATGPLAKTDALDARALAHVAEAVRPTPRPLPDAQAAARRALLARAPAIGRHAHGRTEPSWECTPTAADGHPGPYYLAQHPAGSAGRRPRHDAADESGVA